MSSQEKPQKETVNGTSDTPTTSIEISKPPRSWNTSTKISQTSSGLIASYPPRREPSVSKTIQGTKASTLEPITDSLNNLRILQNQTQNESDCVRCIKLQDQYNKLLSKHRILQERQLEWHCRMTNLEIENANLQSYKRIKELEQDCFIEKNRDSEDEPDLKFL